MPGSRVCGGCGAEASRHRIVFEKGATVASCDQCNPDLREVKFASSTDRKIWMGHEVDPEKYTAREDAEGNLVYTASDEKRADDEAYLSRESTAQEEQAERILAQRRSMGSRTPLTPTQVRDAIAAVRNRMVAEE